MPTKLNYEAMVSQVSEIDWARLAAFIDGEGTVYINTEKPRKPNWSPRYFLSVMITNSDPRLMAWLKGTFFSSVYLVKGGRSPLSRKPIMRWQANGQVAATVLRRCLPYFVMKKAQAEIGIAFESLKTSNRGRRKVSDAEIAAREQHRLGIQKLNSPAHHSVVQ